MADKPLPGEKIARKPIDRSNLRRAAEVVNTEIGPALEDAGVADQELVILNAEFSERNGQNGVYTLSLITAETEDGTEIMFHTGSKVIAEQLETIRDQVGFPVIATFTRQRSKANPRNSYWTVK